MQIYLGYEGNREILDDKRKREVKCLPASDAASLWSVGSQTIDWGSTESHVINSAQSMVFFSPACWQQTAINAISFKLLTDDLSELMTKVVLAELNWARPTYEICGVCWGN